MSKRYYETRHQDLTAPETVMADVMRHFYARQRVGRAVVVCDNPAETMATARRQWMKLSRTLQQRRSAATNAVEILKYTYNITQMQQLRLAAEAPHEDTGAGIYFVRAQDVHLLPPDCLTVYLVGRVQAGALAGIMLELAPAGLVVDYGDQLGQGGDLSAAVLPKRELERAVLTQWQEVQGFLDRYGIDMRELDNPVGRTEIMDEAVDELLENDAEFLAEARKFQRALDLARPLQGIAKAERTRFEVFMLLAHRVQTLAPDGFSTQFLGTYADDGFFLSDNVLPDETLTEAVQRHMRAGRFNLARALMQLAGNSAAVWAAV
jgi:hypothetical protein